jgi:phosphate transport system substrate-binding protein
MSQEDMDNRKSTKFQTLNDEEISSALQRTPSPFLSPPGGEGRGEGRFGHWNFVFGIYLEFGLPARSLSLALNPENGQTHLKPTFCKQNAPAKAGIWNLGFLFLLLFILFPMSCQRSKAGITVAGSTSVEPFAELLAEEYMSRHPESHIYVQGGGSTAGIEAVITRAAHIGMSSRNLTGDEKKLYAVTIAKDAIAIIINPRNPIQDLSLEQIRQVFCGKVRNWNELGGPSHPIVLVTREEGSGTRESFQKFVMGKEDINLEALVQDSNGAVRQVVASNHHAIGYISLGLVNDQVKALKISGVEPNLTDVENGKYTLVRPFLFLFKDEPTGEAKSFLEFVLSPLAQKLLLKEGLVPVLLKTAKE